MLVVYVRYSYYQGNAVSREPAHFTLHFDVLLYNQSNFNVFVKFCYAVIAHIAFHAYLTTCLLLFFANFHRFISNGWCSESKRITVLSKGRAFNLYEPISCFGKSIVLNKLFYTLRKAPFFRTVDLILIVKPDIIIIVMNTDKEISFLFKIYKSSRN